MIQPTKKLMLFFKPLVFLAQKACDSVLADSKRSSLERILLCANKVNEYNAGNCMMQSYVAFDQLLKQLLATELITMQTAIPIGIFTTKVHTFVMVGDLVCDPWANYIGSWEKSPSFGEEISCYFYIGANWNCYSGSEFDENSTNYTLTVVNNYVPKAIKDTDDEALPATSMKL